MWAFAGVRRSMHTKSACPGPHRIPLPRSRTTTGVREKLDDPQYSGFFLKFDASKQGRCVKESGEMTAKTAGIVLSLLGGIATRTPHWGCIVRAANQTKPT